MIPVKLKWSVLLENWAQSGQIVFKSDSAREQLMELARAVDEVNAPKAKRQRTVLSPEQRAAKLREQLARVEGAAKGADTKAKPQGQLKTA